MPYPEYFLIGFQEDLDLLVKCTSWMTTTTEGILRPTCGKHAHRVLLTDTRMTRANQIDRLDFHLIFFQFTSPQNSLEVIIQGVAMRT